MCLGKETNVFLPGDDLWNYPRCRVVSSGVLLGEDLMRGFSYAWAVRQQNHMHIHLEGNPTVFNTESTV